jgi:hypothetical protein
MNPRNFDRLALQAEYSPGVQRVRPPSAPATLPTFRHPKMRMAMMTKPPKPPQSPSTKAANIAIGTTPTPKITKPRMTANSPQTV